MDELSDDAVGLDLVVRGRLAALPDVPTALYAQVAGVVVDSDVLDLASAATGRVVLGEPFVDVGV